MEEFDPKDYMYIKEGSRPRAWFIFQLFIELADSTWWFLTLPLRIAGDKLNRSADDIGALNDKFNQN